MRDAIDVRERIKTLSIPEPNTGCWLWLSDLSKDGYSRIWFDKKKRQAHRVSYAAFIGPIPEGLTIDHRCNVASCVNPDHLQLLTLSANQSRAHLFRPALTHCQRGHAFSADNTYTYKGKRGCIACRNLATLRYRLS